MKRTMKIIARGKSIKPKQTINLKNCPVKGKRELQNRSQDPISIPTSNRFDSLENNEMNSNLSNKSPSIAKDKNASNKNSNDPKPANCQINKNKGLQ